MRPWISGLKILPRREGRDTKSDSFLLNLHEKSATMINVLKMKIEWARIKSLFRGIWQNILILILITELQQMLKTC